MTQILYSELRNKGNSNFKPAIEVIEGFGEYLPNQVSAIQANERNTLNARIAMLERLSKEFKENRAFQGENGSKNKKIAILYIQNMANSTRDIKYIESRFKERFGIDLEENVSEYLDSKTEKEFKLKPETLDKIEKDDFSTSYEKNNAEMMKKALNIPLKTKIKNKIKKIKRKIFKKKEEQLLLPVGTMDIKGKIRPAKAFLSYKEYEEATRGVYDVPQADDPYLNLASKRNVKEPSWKLSQNEKAAIQNANINIAQKYVKEQNQNKIIENPNHNVEGYDEH